MPAIPPDTPQHRAAIATNMLLELGIGYPSAVADSRGEGTYEGKGGPLLHLPSGHDLEKILPYHPGNCFSITNGNCFYFLFGWGDFRSRLTIPARGDVSSFSITCGTP